MTWGARFLPSPQMLSSAAGRRSGRLPRAGRAPRAGGTRHRIIIAAPSLVIVSSGSHFTPPAPRQMAMSACRVATSVAAARPTRRSPAPPAAAVTARGSAQSQPIGNVLALTPAAAPHRRRARRAAGVVAMSAGASPAGETKKLWGGRFSEDIDPLMEKFNESLSFDRRMVRR